MNVITGELNIQKEDVLDFDLYLADATPACTFGVHDEFISSGRLDDLSRTIIAYSFLRNGYNYCLAYVFRKMEIAYKNGTAFREIPVKEEYGLSMLLASGLLQGCAAKHESGR